MGLRAVSNSFDAMHAALAAVPVVAAPVPAGQGLRAVSNAFDAMHAAAEDAAPAEAPAVLDCRLHGPPMRNPRGLWFSPNESGTYSSYAPPCNGCAHGVADACIAKLAAAYHQALYAYRENPTEENKVALVAAHRERYGGEKFRTASIVRNARYRGPPPRR